MSDKVGLIEDVLSATDIVEVVGRYVSLKRAGSNFSWCCPFHNEKTPSFIVSPTKQIFKCFGCWKGGNVYTFVQEIEKIDFWDAVKELAKSQNIDIEKYDNSSKRNAARADEKSKIKRMHTLAQKFYRDALLADSQAQDYLDKQRKIAPQLIEQFGIGYAPDKYYELIQLLRSKGFSDADILEASLAKKNASGEIYAFFRNRITFPIYDVMGNVIAFSARVINPEDKPKYLNSAEHKAFEKSKTLYGLNFAKSHIREYQSLIVVEGQMDVIALAKIGYPIGVATSGTSLTDEHVKLLKRYTENVYLLFDNDKAGHQATLRALKIFYHYNIFPKIIQLDEQWKDVDDLATQVDAKSEFSVCFEKAQDGFLVVYEQLRKSMDMHSPIDKQKMVNQLFDLILSVDSLTIQEHYKSLISEKMGFAFEILDAQFKRYKVTDGRLEVNQQLRKQQAQVSDRYEPSREELFASLLYQGSLERYLPSSPWAAMLRRFAVILTGPHDSSLLSKVLSQQLSEQDIQQLDELSLWWDKHLEELLEEEKRYQAVFQVLRTYIQQTSLFALKSSSLSAEQKKELLQLQNSFRR